MMKILLLEDVETDAKLIEWELHKKKLVFEMKRVETKKEFCDALENDTPDIVLSDCQLPFFNGREALEIIQKKFPDIPLIIVSGAISDETAIDLLKDGAKDYILKDRIARITPAILRTLEEKEILLAKRRTDEERTRLVSALRKSLENTLLVLAKASEIRDPYTAGHQRKVAKLAVAIASEMHLDQEKIHSIELAALIHDIGKLNVPTDILSKPGTLSPIEFQLVQTHSQIGYDILKDIEFPWPIAEIVLEHHEKIDGSGYPRGLKGEEIMVEARIVTVSDVVEAICFNRPYRKALGVEIALDDLRANKGTLYDPKVVDCCLKLFNENRFAFADDE